ncbi:hypothetical protein CEXT_356021 [Caerostris extrusa]|uniref:Uncharacterized protein n=1 Tax=Caerostris extrusa TaxID=172846 RepID=A0AAV4QYE2_CAEEX|nr:hypothetical protein CEXT_356021 [Caerostris extrusa]
MLLHGLKKLRKRTRPECRCVAFITLRSKPYGWIFLSTPISKEDIIATIGVTQMTTLNGSMPSLLWGRPFLSSSSWCNDLMDGIVWAIPGPGNLTLLQDYYRGRKLVR